MKIPQILLQAGGKGTRLSSLKLGVPKPIAPIGRQPFLGIVLKWLKKCGFKSIIITINKKDAIIKDTFKSGSAYGLNVEYVIEKEAQGTAVALFNALPRIKNEFIIINGDTAFNFNPLDLLKIGKQNKNAAIMAMVKKTNTSRYGKIILGHNNRIIKFIEKNQKGPGWVSAGVVYLNKKIMQKYARNKSLASFEKDVLPKLINQKTLYGLKVKGNFWDIGTPRSYRYFIKNYSKLIKNDY